MDISMLIKKPRGTKVFVPDKYSVQFSRGKLGQSLSPETQDFDLRDPNITRNLWDYNCLHDKHLKKFFKRPEKKKRLVQLGLITPDERVLCSVKQFTNYVEYLRHAPLKQDSPESSRRKPKLTMTCMEKPFSRPEKQRTKPKLIY
ncbi:fibrous sheath-interacting protein 2 [Astyanax mexicanus]|uniref:fibrous sheath-interacting protein 2 n=1 Tax=Astyanax mexicanus TaxID=7994 RepID=UPI000BBDF503|nr:fibrous sheath-interacting protein 2 [Astyanax mexicanus]